MLKKQTPLSEQANAKKLAKLENEKGIKAEAVKKLNFDEIKKLIDESPNNGKDIIVIGEDNLTPEIVEYIHKKHAKVGIERLDEDEITAFNFTYPKNAKAIIDYQGIQHALNKHGINSPSVKFSKQPPITYKDIANYRDIVKNADETIKRDNRIISYKQVNGHFVVVEQINRNKSEFIFKTMFKKRKEIIKMHQIIRKILKKMIKKPHLDHTQALSSYVSGSLGTLKVFLWVRNIL